MQVYHTRIVKNWEGAYLFKSSHGPPPKPTLTELIEPFGLNDNVTIPVFSSIALQFGFSRISSCHVGQGQGVALLKEIFSNFDWLY